MLPPCIEESLEITVLDRAAPILRGSWRNTPRGMEIPFVLALIVLTMFLIS